MKLNTIVLDASIGPVAVLVTILIRLNPLLQAIVLGATLLYTIVKTMIALDDWWRRRRR